MLQIGPLIAKLQDVDIKTHLFDSHRELLALLDGLRTLSIAARALNQVRSQLIHFCAQVKLPITSRDLNERGESQTGGSEKGATLLNKPSRAQRDSQLPISSQKSLSRAKILDLASKTRRQWRVKSLNLQFLCTRGTVPLRKLP